MTPPEPAVVCHGVERTYRIDRSLAPALRGVSLALPADTITALVGPSGSGKTTLLRLLACVDRPDTGRISSVPQPNSDTPARRSPNLLHRQARPRSGRLRHPRAAQHRTSDRPSRPRPKADRLGAGRQCANPGNAPANLVR